MMFLLPFVHYCKRLIKCYARVAEVSLLFVLILLIAKPLQAQTTSAYHTQKGLGYYKDQNYKAAIPELELALKLDSSELQIYSLLSTSYMQERKWRKAINVAYIGVRQLGAAPVLTWISGESYLQLGEYEKAAADLKLLSMSLKLPPNVNATQVNERLGQCYSQMGGQAAQNKDISKALEYYTQALPLLKTKSFVYVNVAFAHIQLNNWPQALKTANEGLSLFPSNVALWKAKGRALFEQKKYKEASQIYSHLYQLDTNDINMGIVLGELLMSTQHYEKASLHYDQMLKKSPREKAIYESLINVNEQRLNYKGKVEILQQMLQYFDKEPIYLRIAKTYEKIENWESARAYYDTLSALANNNTSYQKKIALTYTEEGDFQKAILLYEELYQKYPKDKDILDQLGKSYEQMAEWDKARDVYIHWTTLQTSPKLYERLGYVHQKMGLIEESTKYYQKALEYGGSATAYLGLSQLAKNSFPDSSLHMAQKAFNEAFKVLEDSENQLNERLQGRANISDLVNNKSLIKEIKELESRAIETFYHLSSYPFDQVNTHINGLNKQFPNSARVYFLMGEFNFKHEQTGKALADLSRSTALDSKQKEAHELIGAIYESKGEYNQSIMAFERALSLDDQSGHSYQCLIRLYQNIGALNTLCDKWMIRYRSLKNHDTMKPFLIEALHKADRYEEARKIIGEKI